MKSGLCFKNILREGDGEWLYGDKSGKIKTIMAGLPWWRSG